MKYPSEYLEDLVPVVDRLEDRALDRYEYARSWLSGFKVWNWPEQARRIEDLKHKNRALVRELRELQQKYRAETGKVPTGNLTLVWADDEGWSSVFRKFRQAFNDMGVRR